jgi:hypothetical protein
MKGIPACVVLGGSIGVLVLVLGCGERRPVPNLDAAAKAKVDAINKLADEMAKVPDGLGARGALENFRIIPLDALKYPKEAQEIAETYLQRIKGKYRGNVAQELQAEVSQYLAKKGK